jgi:glucosamine--fructose-6-phosphate aminotransferase (isomerizing)
MCGIMGYVGVGSAVELVLGGLRWLEYRGYDSAGLAAIEDDQLDVVRSVGRVESLAAAVAGRKPLAEWRSGLAIGHTRWATHGRPTEANAHPHCDDGRRVAVVHNGIIENHAALRRELESNGHKFNSDTDTEVAAHLIGSRIGSGLILAVEWAMSRIEGTFALAVVSPICPGLLVGARRGSSLVAGVAPDGSRWLSSDAAALPESSMAIFMGDEEVVALESGRQPVLRRGGLPVEPRLEAIQGRERGDRGAFNNFMLKEIHEQPAALRRLILEAKNWPSIELEPFSRVVIVAQGTSYHAGLIGRNFIEAAARVPVQVEYGSDFRYRDPVLDPSVLVVAISQSGETADTLGAMRIARAIGCRTLSITNVMGSAMARESDCDFNMRAGPEIGVASTKSFTSQVAALHFLAAGMGAARGALSPINARLMADDMALAPSRVEEALVDEPAVRDVALKYKDARNAIYLGRGTGYPLALEGALKLKEVSYIHAEGIDAAEMKHGPIALIDEEMPVVVLALQGSRYEKIMSNISEVKARGGKVIAIASHDDARIGLVADDVLRVRDDRGMMNAVACAVPLQLMAYHMALARGCDVDKPRHLAKSVTVE